MIADPAAGPQLDPSRLLRPVRAALKAPDATVIDFEMTPLRWSALAPTTGGLHLVTGTARVGGNTRRWEMILKVVKRAARSVEDPSHPEYWRREPDAFASGLLAGLAGVSAPGCYGTVRFDAEGIVWLFLERVAEIESNWVIGRYALAARALGAFNGSYLARGSLPEVAWLARGWLRWWSGWVGPSTEKVARDPATWEIPLVRQAFPRPLTDRILGLVERAPRLLEALDALPPTVSHQDGWRANLLAARDDRGGDRTVLLDWAFVGLAPVGLDAAILLAGSHFWLLADPAAIEDFDRAVFHEYLAGLADVGAQGDPDDVRFAYTTSAAVYGGLTAPVWLSRWGDPSRRGWLEEKFRRPLADAVRPYARALTFFLDLGDEAWRLLEARG